MVRPPGFEFPIPLLSSHQQNIMQIFHDSDENTHIQRRPNEGGVGMGYWRFDCIILLLILLGLSLVILALLFASHIDLVLILLYIGVGFLLFVIAIVLAWHPKDGYSLTLTEGSN